MITRHRRARFASEQIGGEDDPAPYGKETSRFGKTVISRGVLCEECCKWYHFSCAGTSQSAVKILPADEPFICQICRSRSSGITQQMDGMMIDDDTYSSPDLLRRWRVCSLMIQLYETTDLCPTISLQTQRS